MADRISRKPSELATQCTQAATGITAAGVSWPAGAPTALAMTNHAATISSKLAQIATAEAALRIMRQELEGIAEPARADMQKVDQATDLMYGPDGAQKQNFGLTPKKAASAYGTPDQVVITATADGVDPASLFVDWDTIPAAVYEVQWAAAPTFAPIIGTMTVTESQATIPNLTRGTQYWIRVRAVRASQNGSWSDPATRVANV
jgi:hypothetical protein